jgi:hypothetical protein
VTVNWCGPHWRFAISRFTKVLGIVALALVINVGAAKEAGHGGHGSHGGVGTVVVGIAAEDTAVAVGGLLWGGFAGGAILGGLLAVPYYYGGPGYYYGAGDCGWVRVRVFRHGHRVVRRVWRCW